MPRRMICQVCSKEYATVMDRRGDSEGVGTCPGCNYELQLELKPAKLVRSEYIYTRRKTA
jgi:hydrogenase maturation factor HypF (carbamoyltransferase family)